MPLPSGFFELSPLPGALGPFEGWRKTTDDSFPAFGRFRIKWRPEGLMDAPRLQPMALGYPAAVLYGGPAPQAWTKQNLATWVAQWSNTLPAPADAPPGRWEVEVDAPALLVPPEALPFPYGDFRWVWALEQQKPDVYQIEGMTTLPQFRNLRTGMWDRPGPFGNMFGEIPPVSVGAEPQKVALVAEGTPETGGPAPQPKVEMIPKELEDEVDPPSATWVTPEQDELSPVWPPWIVDDNNIGAEPRSLVRIQCGSVQYFDGVHVECPLAAGHPGKHRNWPYTWELGLEALVDEIGTGQERCPVVLMFGIQDNVRVQCIRRMGHRGPHHHAPYMWPEDKAAETTEIGAAPKKAWYRIHYLDVITQNDAWAPYQWLTAAAAKAWQQKRTKYGSQVMALLEQFSNERGWQEV